MNTKHTKITREVIAEPRWKWFTPPLWWCFRWAYRISKTETLENDKVINIRQYQRGGNNSTQVQIGIVHEYNTNGMEDL